MKRMYKSMGGVILLGILPWAYAYSLGSSVPASSTPATPPSPGGTHPIEALDQNIVQLLTQIQSQLQTITSQQSQMQQSFQGYTQFEIMSAYPSSSYSSGAQMSSMQQSNLAGTGAGSLKLLLNPNNSVPDYQNAVRSQVLQGVMSSLGQSPNDSGVLGEINRYASSLGSSGNNSGSLLSQQLQTQQLTNQLLVLNAKASYLQYQEELRLEALLSAQLFVNAQQKPNNNPL